MNSNISLDENHEFILRNLQGCIENRKFNDAINIASEKLALYPEVVGYKKCLAYCFGMVGELFKSKDLWIELVDADPYSEETLMNLADVEHKLGRLDSSLGLLKLVSQYHPSSVKPWLNMAGIHIQRNEFQECVNVSLEAIQRDPKNADGFQNLGSALFHLAMLDEAQHAFETALTLNPDIKEAKNSLGSVLFRKNKNEEALKISEELIASSITTDRIPIEQLRWNASFIYLRLGHLMKGWEYYEDGMSPHVTGSLLRRPMRSFKVPRWTPSSPKNQTVLVWREQGIGDEIIFLTCLHDLIELGFKLIVECDKRLAPLVERSFPTILAREAMHRLDFPHDSLHNDFDCHIPMGSLMRHFRQEFLNFPDSSRYIKPDSNLVDKWRERLGSIANGKKTIGLSWKSGLADPLRNAKHSSLLDWSELLTTKNLVFVNLQYGNCIDEIKHVEKILGAKIHTWEDLDLKNDVEDIVGLLINLDHVVTTSSAVWTFAASSGVPTSLLLHTPHWTMFNQNRIPFFPKVDCHLAKPDQPIFNLLTDVIKKINSH
jgi:tetratricopeptide (TPR) repeat protein